MARTFATAPSLSIPLRTTWQEPWQVLQDDGVTPVDLTGYSARMQLRDPITGLKVLELDSGGYLTITPLTGSIDLEVPSDIVQSISSSNKRRRLIWDMEVYIPGSPDFVVPIFRGIATFTPRVTQPGVP